MRFALLVLLVMTSAGLRAQTGYAALEQIYRQDVDAGHRLATLRDAEPGNPWVHHFEALLRADCRARDGLDAAREAVRLDPDQAWHRKLLGELQLADGRPGEAVGSFREALERETRAEVREELSRQLAAAQRALRVRGEQQDEMTAFESRVGWLSALAVLLGLAALVLAFRRRAS
ncbi:MAG: hypothetical protein H6807_03625 [Planctomycetes bacterium]|nr:hypothetical protein [Planctomycetota bacterium]